MSRKKNRKKDPVNKSKRPTPTQQRTGERIMEVTPDLSGMSAYKTRPPKRHRGPVTTGAVPGTGKGAMSRARRGK
jgi:hypothetical protein